MVVEKEFFERIKLPEDYIQITVENVSVITIKLPKEALATYGVFYFFLKSLAWDAINVIEIFSTLNTLSIVVEDQNVERSFSIIKSLVSGKQDY